jgi:HKD family nuclease
MSRLKEGLYDQLVTRSVRDFLDQEASQNLKSLIDELEETDSPEYLARHLARQIKDALRGLPAEDRKRRQIELANALLEFVRERANPPDSDAVDHAGQVLRAIYSGATAPIGPTTPLSATNLLMNALGEPRLGFELEREMATADQVFMVVSFIQWRGWQRLKDAFLTLADRNVPVRILTTTYIGATDMNAVLELSRLPNVQLRMSLDGRRRRLHAKAWLFQRDNGFSSVYVGSANLSGPALEDGIEWTVKLSEVEAPQIVDRFRGAFDSLWCDEEFEEFRSDDEEMHRRVRHALEYARRAPGQRDSGPPIFFDLRPHPYQQATLDQLESERADRESFRNLVVAPTGTGKTAGRPIVREPSLVFLGTTSLYGSEPTQYTRLHMSCEKIGGFHEDVLRYRLLGQTQGFGTFQFSDDTVDALQTALSQSKRGQRVNSIFGEGASPRMRKVREGLDLLNLPSDLLLRHGAPRLVYGVSLVRNLKRYLLGQDSKPDYLFPIENVEDATQRISAWWAERWLARRVQNLTVIQELAQHRLTYPVRHGARVDIPEEGLLPFDSAGFLPD